MINLTTPLNLEKIKTLKKGDTVMLSGKIFTARDAAHKKIAEHYLATGEMLLASEVIYYAGPCPNKPNEVIGSVGPTTSYRMDTYSELFLSNGCLVSIGKGNRDSKTTSLIKKFGGVHFDAIGGAGAYYKNCVKKAEVVYFEELGAEAVFCLTVENFPLIVNII